jgi:hypothetical protein
VQYSAIAARTVRAVLKPKNQEAAGKRAITSIKFQKWENGKTVGPKFVM